MLNAAGRGILKTVALQYIHSVLGRSLNGEDDTDDGTCGVLTISAFDSVAPLPTWF